MDIPLSADAVMERYFLEVRCKLLEVAATLDRLDRAPTNGNRISDPRRAMIDEAFALLQNGPADRAARLQLHFSRAYDPKWIESFPPFAERNGKPVG